LLCILRYCRGVVGIVDVPSIVLEPTHNKQSFADEKEYHFLLKNMGEYMRQYWSDAGIENYVKEFWETYGNIFIYLHEFDFFIFYILGYRDDQLDRPPSNDPEVVKRRQAAVPMLIQCDKCLKWRRLPYAGNVAPLTQNQLEIWRCADNTDVMNNKYVYLISYAMYKKNLFIVNNFCSCSVSEKLEAIPEGELKQKPQATSTQNRTSAKAPSPPPPPTASLTTRSSVTNKRISNGEISSTTAAAAKSLPSRTNIVPASITPQKRSIPPSRSLSAKAKSKAKRRRPVSQQSNKSKTRAAKIDDDEVEEEQEEEEEESEEEEEPPTIENTKTRGQTSTKPTTKTPPSTPIRVCEANSIHCLNLFSLLISLHVHQQLIIHQIHLIQSHQPIMYIQLIMMMIIMKISIILILM
jgi:hypothetical protein